MEETSEVVQTQKSEREVRVTCEYDRECVASWDLPPTLVFDLLIDHRQNKQNMKDKSALPALTPGSQSSPIKSNQIRLGRD